jgi:ArsR family transcriptional regulator
MTDSFLDQRVTQLRADICSAIADPRRILLLYAIDKKVRNVTELGAAVNISQSSASRHLKILRDRGLVRATRNGPSVEYSLSDHRLIEALDLLCAISQDCMILSSSAAALSEPRLLPDDTGQPGT